MGLLKRAARTAKGSSTRLRSPSHLLASRPYLTGGSALNLKTGSAAPRLELQVDGHSRPVPASAAPQALFFFKVSCPTCPLAAPAIERLRRAYPRLETIAVSQDDLESSRAWMAQVGLGSPLAIDAERFAASEAFGLATVPTVVLLDHEGKIAQVQEGYSRLGYDSLAANAAYLVGAQPERIASTTGPAFQPG
jgi:peroxiredoxin